MYKFRATAFNSEGLTFPFYFLNHSWNEIQEAARKKLDEIVANDTLHQKHGPWSFCDIDIKA